MLRNKTVKTSLNIHVFKKLYSRAFLGLLQRPQKSYCYFFGLRVLLFKFLQIWINRFSCKKMDQYSVLIFQEMGLQLSAADVWDERDTPKESELAIIIFEDLVSGPNDINQIPILQFVA